MSLSFRPAVRSNSVPIIGLYGPSGSGKTFSALLLARGIAGPAGKIAFIDTESRRGEMYADKIPGGYDVLPFDPPFTSERYSEAISSAEQGGHSVVIIDSVSHEWEGIGGVLAQADQNEIRTKKPGLHCWKKPKSAHQMFVFRLLQTKIPVIVCMRGKHKSRQVRGQGGKTKIIEDDFASPIQAKDFIFEMTVHAEVMPDHTLNVTKEGHPDLVPVFVHGQKITIETGERLAAWSKEGGAPPVRSSTDIMREAAQNGTDALRDAWQKLDGAGKKSAKPIMDALKEDAAAIDAAIDDDDPFADDAEPSADTQPDQPNEPPDDPIITAIQALRPYEPEIEAWIAKNTAAIDEIEGDEPDRHQQIKDALAMKSAEAEQKARAAERNSDD